MYNENLRPEKEVVLCEDGTNTLFSKEFNEPYHSTRDGALHESLEKHVKPSLALKKINQNLSSWTSVLVLVTILLLLSTTLKNIN